MLQNATNLIVSEEGDPVNWSWANWGNPDKDEDHSNIEHIVDMYKKHLKVSYTCPFWLFADKETNCYVLPAKYRFLNGEFNAQNTNKNRIFYYSAPLVLEDGTLVAINFKYTFNAVFWALPDILFTVDVNGKKGPNQIGRDVFFIYMNKNEQGRLRPYTNEEFKDGPADFRNSCDKDKTGYSCAFRVFQERKMDY